MKNSGGKMKIKLVVGLGNPGREYENTRHNMGFKVLDIIAQNMEIYKWKQRDGALYFDCFYDMCRVIFLKPQEFINLSGNVIKRFVDFFDIKTEDIIIISDDLDMPVGSLKLKERGSSGGHNGLKNIEEKLGTKEYKRIKIGISNNKEIDTKDYVLGKITKEEKKVLDPILKKVANIALEAISKPFSELMNKYNTKIKN